MRIKTLDQVKREHILKALRLCNWNIGPAAFYLDVSERSIRNFIAKNSELVKLEKDAEKNSRSFPLATKTKSFP